MKMTAVLMVLSGLLAVSGVASASDATSALKAPAAPAGTLLCAGQVVAQRPVWQRVLSLGFLGEQTQERVVVEFPGVPGGTDAIRMLKSRNADLEIIFNTLSQRMSPQLISSDFVCSSPGSDPMRLTYQKSGKMVIEDASL